MRIGDSIVMLFDAKENWPPTPGFFRLFVEDADAVCARAVEAGGSPVTEVTELFFGDRVGRISDPAGNIWWIQSHVADLIPRRWAGEPASRGSPTPCARCRNPSIASSAAAIGARRPSLPAPPRP